MSPLLAMFGTHYWEILIIGLVVLLLFGNRLPGVMRSLGRGIVEFKKGTQDDDALEGDSQKDVKV